MAELPEISKFAKQMDETFKGKKISSLKVGQEKCINVPVKDFSDRITNAEITGARYKGKWMILHLNNDENILISMGMGGDILFYKDPAKTPEKHHIRISFSDGTGFTVKYWWFGKFLICSDKDIDNEPNTGKIGTDPFDDDFTYEHFRSLFKGKGQVKAFILDQKNIGGIGNMYAHDILFKAKIHPQRKIADMSEENFRALYDSIIYVLRYSESKGAFSYEGDIFGEKGAFTIDDLLAGYREGKPCPECGSPIVQIKTGGTSSFICEKCQML